MKKQYDRHKKESWALLPGTKVFLEAKNITTTRPSKKLAERRLGPFEVLEKVGHSAYKLKLPNNWTLIHPVFNEYLLTPLKAARFASQQKPSPPPPDVIEGSEEYEVECIRKAKKKNGRLLFWVHWKGYPEEENTWENRANLKHSADLVKDFYLR